MHRLSGLSTHCAMWLALTRPLRSFRRRLFPVYTATNRRNESQTANENDEELSEEKRKVLDLVLDGASLFIGGDAGTGKTYLLRRIADTLRANGLRVAVTASTGIAALRIGGNTFHSTFGVPVICDDERSVGSVCCSAPRIQYDVDTLASIDAIIIDEISLLHSVYIEALEAAARAAPMRRHDIPFGGIQVICSGDFMQIMHGNNLSSDASEERIVCVGVKKHNDSLPDVDMKVISPSAINGCNNCDSPVLHTPRRGQFDHRPLFESLIFQKCLLHVRLCTQMRQSVDTQFVEDLTQLRFGVLTHRMSRSAFYNSEAPDAIHLFPTKRAVAAFNEKRILDLSGPEHFFPSKIEVFTSDGAESSSSATGPVLVVHFRNKLMRSIVWRQRAEEMIYRLALKCGLGNAVRIMIPPVPPRYSNHLTVYVRFMGAGGDQGVRNPMAVMLAAINAKLLGKSPEAAKTRRTWGTVVWEVRQPDLFTRNMRSSIERSYGKMLQKETVLQSKRLKIGCRVMLLRNLSKEFVNGTIGTIVRFEPLHCVTHLLPKDLKQLLAPKSFAALCSKPTLSGGTGDAVSPETDYDVRDNKTIIPVVQIDRLDDDDDDGTKKNIKYQEVAIPWISIPLLGAQRNGFYSVRVAVMPLTPAYAFTVHKVQGLTFDRPVLFDAQGFFPCDHLIYVAASRVKRYSQFRMINVSPRMVTVHRGALRFTLGIPTPEEAVNTWRQWTQSKLCRNKRTDIGNSSRLSLFRASWKLRSSFKSKKSKKRKEKRTRDG